MPKILIASYSAEAHASYSMVVRELWRRLQKMNPDWKIIQHGWMHTSSEAVSWEILPTRRVQTKDGVRWDPSDRFGQVTFIDIVKRFKPDIVWGLGDPYMLDYMGQYRANFGFKLIKHLPADGAPQPESYRDGVNDCDEVVAITDYGRKALTALSGRKIERFVYHGVDTDRFHPIPQFRQERPEVRKVTRKSFLLSFVGHSQWRKQNWLMFKVLRYLIEGCYCLCSACNRVSLAPWDDILNRPSDTPKVCWYCHSTNVTHPGPRDVGLWYHTFDRSFTDFNPERLKQIWGVEDNVVFTQGQQNDKGKPDAEMPQVYQIADAYLGLSGGEGFCMPFTEAMACGLPIVYTDYSGQAEVGAYGGLPVRYVELQPQPLIPINRAIADVGDAVRQVLRLMDDKKLYQDLSLRGQAAARDVFDWSLIASQWNRIIESHLDSPSVPTLGVSI